MNTIIRKTKPSPSGSDKAGSSNRVRSQKRDRVTQIDVNAAEQFKRDIIAGLSAQPKTLPCKYFYDARGSELFEEICRTPEYYVTRTETSLLKRCCATVASRIGPGAHVLEPGSGAGEKIRLLLDALDTPRSMTLIDISESAIEASARELEQAYPQLRIHPLVADFTEEIELPTHFFEEPPSSSTEPPTQTAPKLVFFPGSTISNFTPSEAVPFLRRLGNWLAEGDFLFIGVDREKNSDILERAYDDAAGVTAEFNLNLLSRIKNELETDLDPTKFEHRAVYNRTCSRIEMHLDSREDQVVHIEGQRIEFRRGESIHTENSYKYSPKRFRDLAEKAGYLVTEQFSDDDELFALYLCQVPSATVRDKHDSRQASVGLCVG